MARITEIEGIGPANLEKLTGVGIKTVETLREVSKTRKGRQELAKKTGVNETSLLAWVNRADLFRVRGIGAQYSELLELAGVDTIVELSKRVPTNLHQKLLEINTDRKLVRQLPTLKQVSNWVEQAKLLPRQVEY